MHVQADNVLVKHWHSNFCNNDRRIYKPWNMAQSFSYSKLACKANFQPQFLTHPQYSCV